MIQGQGVKGSETHLPLREVILEEMFLTPIDLLEPEKRMILDQTDNSIRDQWGAPIFDGN